jgi:hypothetical protein
MQGSANISSLSSLHDKRISFGFWNCEGVANAILHGSLTDFGQCDVWGLAETFATHQFLTEEFYSYHTYATLRNGPGRPAGGVSVLLAPRVNVGMEILKRDENTIVLASPHLSIVAMYASPALPSDVLIEQLSDALSLTNYACPILLMADLNCRLDQFPPSPRTQAVTTLLADLGLWIANDPTIKTYRSFNGASTVDIFATNICADRVSPVTYAEGLVIPYLRKHIPITLSIAMRTEPNTSSPRISRLSKSLNQSCLRTNELWLSLARPAECSPSFLAWALAKLITTAAPMPTPPKRTSPPWFDRECFQARARVLELKHKLLLPTSGVEYEQYSAIRKTFKELLNSKRKRRALKDERELVARAENSPHEYRSKIKARAICPVPPDRMRTHFENLADNIDTIPTSEVSRNFVDNEEQARLLARINADFTVEEVAEGINKLKNNKAEGPDQIRNEHLKQATILLPLWALLFSMCLRIGFYPTEWRDCVVSMIFKGKGDLLDPSSWRGISKKCVPGKLLSALIATRLYRYLAQVGGIPVEQHGFVRGRSTESAVRGLLRVARERLLVPRRYLYAVFVDFRAAFDTVSRSAILYKLSELGVRGNIACLLIDMLQQNKITLDDGLALMPHFFQRTGLPQGDTISSLLFIVALYDIPARIKAAFPTVDVILYADDLVLHCASIKCVNEALNLLADLAAECGLRINLPKTKAMKFRRGGRLAASDVITLHGTDIPFVSKFCYLGFTISSSAKSFAEHVRSRKVKAITAIATIPDLRKLSVATGLKLFSLKIAPIASYGIRVTWCYLKLADLINLDAVKTAFLRRLLGLHGQSRSRLVYLISDTPTFIEELVQTFRLPYTPALHDFLRQQEQKFAEVDPNIYTTPALSSNAWRAPLMDARHAICRHALHGFHHLFCTNRAFHSPDDSCSCQFCHQSCEQYHSTVCLQSPYTSLLNMASQ